MSVMAEPNYGPTPCEVLSFSGGWQSSALLWMVIRGDIDRPKHFAVVNADPGDELTATGGYVDQMEVECRAAGIEFLRAKSDDIGEDFSAANESQRIDTIPYWTKNPDGSRGRLMHACTRHYKVRPMQRATTKWIQRYLCVKKGQARRQPVINWVGFAADEKGRTAKEIVSGRWGVRYPLIERGITKDDCQGYIRDNRLPEPQISVCAGCFSHGLRRLKWMHDNDRPAWNRSVERDNYVRHGLKQYGVDNPCYISDTLIPLETLAEQGFKLGTTKETVQHECQSGACFL